MQSWHTRGTSLAASILIALSVTITAYAQGPAGGAAGASGAANPAEIADDPITAEELAKLVLKLKQQVDKNTKLIEANTQLIQNNNTLNQQLRQQLDDAVTQINDQFARQGEIIKRQTQILSAISTQDSSGVDVLRLSAIMEQSPDFADDVGKVVDQAIRKTGRFVVVNKMSTDQTIVINGTTHSVPVGQYLQLEVPTGTVAAELPGQDPTYWTVRPPDYSFTLNIIPRQTALRPVVDSTVTTLQRPVYVTPLDTYYDWPATEYVDPWWTWR